MNDDLGANLLREAPNLLFEVLLNDSEVFSEQAVNAFRKTTRNR